MAKKDWRNKPREREERSPELNAAIKSLPKPLRKKRYAQRKRPGRLLTIGGVEFLIRACPSDEDAIDVFSYFLNGKFAPRLRHAYFEVGRLKYEHHWVFILGDTNIVASNVYIRGCGSTPREIFDEEECLPWFETRMEGLEALAVDIRNRFPEAAEFARILAKPLGSEVKQKPAAKPKTQGLKSKSASRGKRVIECLREMYPEYSWSYDQTSNGWSSGLGKVSRKTALVSTPNGISEDQGETRIYLETLEGSLERLSDIEIAISI